MEKDEQVSRLFDMPYTADGPRLVNPELGLHNLVARAGHNAGYTIDVTLLDAPDHRLIRSGVLLAHRVLDGRGEWYLGAPTWAPELPAERIELMGHADMPVEFADLVRPFRRRATVGPVAGLSCERREFALKDDHGRILALLRDDKVTVRRGGLITARFREVMMTPIGPGLIHEQIDWLDQAFVDAGATRVPKFPRLVSRLGAPATGLTDLPLPQDPDPDAPFTHFVSGLLARRLREIVVADLGLRTGRSGSDISAAGLELVERVRQLRRELEGISSVLDPEWVEDLDEELGWIALVAESEPDQLTNRMRGERYLTLLERLVNAARAPKLGDSEAMSTIDVLSAVVDTAITRLRKAGKRLMKDDSLQAWERAVLAAEQAGTAIEVSDPIVAKSATAANKKGHRTVDTALTLITEAGRHRQAADENLVDLETATPEAAFERGRDYEHELVRHRTGRAAFLADWPGINKALNQ